MVDEVLEEVQLVRSPASCPAFLSSGQRRRLAASSGLRTARKLLILDEPEQRLDTEGVAWLAQRQVERQKGLAIVFASHEPELVERWPPEVVSSEHRADEQLGSGRR